MRSNTNASDQPNIDLSAGPAGRTKVDIRLVASEGTRPSATSKVGCVFIIS